MIIEGDSLSVIKKYNSEYPDKLEICAHIRNIKSFSHKFQRLCFQHDRMVNDLANTIAIESLRKNDGFYLVHAV